MKIKYLPIVLLLILTLLSCRKDDPDIQADTGLSNGEICEWIYYNMNYIYLWEEFIPQGLDPLSEDNPMEFYYDLLYKEEDKWSFITSDYTSFSSELEGTPISAGFSPAFGRFSGSDKVFMVIKYVYENSPASNSGLKRGDIVLTVNDIQLDTINYRDMLQLSSYTVGLAEYNDTTLIETGETISLSSEIISTNPVLHYEVIDSSGINTGYLVYSEFISGSNDIFLRELDMAMNDFLDAGIKDLIVDLRYNPGGEITTAGYLASCLAPGSVSSDDVLVSVLYNDFLENYHIDLYGSATEALNYNFPGSNLNLNLNRIFFLTSDNSASASELVISGLEPYMEVVIVGDSSYGKYTGAMVLPDNEDPPQHNWAIIPIVLKYANANGFTDFKDGLYPDYIIEEDLLNLVAFGDKSDPLLSQALAIIGGNSKKTTKISKPPNAFLKLKDPKQDIKKNLFINLDL